MNELFYSLCEIEYTWVFRSILAQEIWKFLQVTHKGTSQVKDSKISLLTLQFEVFKLENGESINVTYNRFNDIVAAVQNLSKNLASDEINRKLFASRPIEWSPKVTVIKEAKNLKTITTEELLGSLITNKHTLERDHKEKEVDKRKKKDLALQLLMGNMKELDQALYSRNFMKFVNKKVVDKRSEEKKWKNKEEKKKEKGKKVLQATLEKDDENELEEFL